MLKTIKQSDFTDKLMWFFTDKSILDEDIISDRFEKGLVNTTITKEVDVNSLLSVDNRLKIKKIVSFDTEFNISLCTKVKWKINIEYYSLNEIDENELQSVYSDIKNKINEKRKKKYKLRPY